jgi:heavy metal translocating P-type ATPase
MADPDCTCCSSKESCHDILEEKEPSSLEDGQHPTHEIHQHQQHHDNTLPSSFPNINTPEIRSTIDVEFKDSLLNTHSHSSCDCSHNEPKAIPSEKGPLSSSRPFRRSRSYFAGQRSMFGSIFRRFRNDESTKSAHTHVSDTCCSDGHCSDGTLLKELDAHFEPASNDVERGSASFVRITLTVTGLKCGCCETGISKALQQISAITNHQINIVLAKVEFDLNTSVLSVAEVIARLRRATGYTFEQYDQPEGQTLELLVNDPTEIFCAGRPYGVTSLEGGEKPLLNPSILMSGRSSPMPPEISKQGHSADKPSSGKDKRTNASLYMHAVQIHYDAKKIGARDVFEYYQQLAPNQNIQPAPAKSEPSLAAGKQQTYRACLIFLTTLAISLPVLVFAWSPLRSRSLAYSHASLALATLVQMIAIHEFIPGAFQSLVHSGLFEMDFLVALSTTTAYIFSVISYVFQMKKRPLETGSFFETSTLLVTLILLGRAVSEFARFTAAKSVSIRSLQTQDALLIVSEGAAGPGSQTRKIDARLLQYGDKFMVLPHTRIVTDGDVVYGGSEVDESMITGESLPVAKGLGRSVHAGAMNGSGHLIIALTKLPHENSISRIALMVENAELSKPKIQALADRIAGLFVPTIAAIGLAVFLIWMLLDRYHNKRRWQVAVVKAITYAIATLVVSCPCAIGLAVPMVVLIAGGISARFGIIFRDPQKLEVARNISDIVFDKTGTLTTGHLLVVEHELYEPYPQNIKGMIGSLLKGEKHPVAVAILKWAEEDAEGDEVAAIRMVDIKSEPGNGVVGKCLDTGVEIRAGNPEWLDMKVLDSKHTVLCVAIDGGICATFRLEDKIRPEAEKVISQLTSRGIKVHMTSGDTEGAVKEAAHTLNIFKPQTAFRLKPNEKARYIHELQKDGRTVMFCGDGTNDSVALKQADVGVHMGHGSDIAKNASDVVLMNTHLQNILILLDISQAAYRKIILNFAWSAVYNIVAILMAAGAFVKIRIDPAYAGLGELVSVLPVVLIAFELRLRDYGKKYAHMSR